MKNKGKLYLIPSSLGSKSYQHIIPAENKTILEKLDIFIVENVRTARRFLRSCGYSKDFDKVKFYILNKHTMPEDIPSFFERINEQDIGLLSEAGLPCIADPGALVVKMAHQQSIEVMPLVGPSSIMLALMASGFNGQNFVFHGYLPIQKKERESKILAIEKHIWLEDQTQIFIETPYRNHQMIESIISKCKPDTMLCVACNLSLHDQKIVSQNINAWKKTKLSIHKKPAVFLLYK